MRKSSYSEKLEWFKMNEKPETILLITDSPLLRKIVIAWTTTPVWRAKRLSKLEDSSEESAWRWLWKNARYSEEEFLARIPSSDANRKQKIDMLIANRVLYPDGTANSFTEKYLREMVRRQFTRKSDKMPRATQ